MNVPRRAIKASKAVLAATLAATMCPIAPAMASENQSAGTPNTEISTLADTSDQPINVDWTNYGTCEWSIIDGHMTIRPTNGDTGYMPLNKSWPYTPYPWEQYKKTVSSISFEGKIVPADTSLNEMFYDMPSLATVDLSGLETSTVTNMSSMFYGCESLQSVDINNLDTSSVTNMRRMFLGCSSLPSLDLSSWKTSNLVDMDAMFTGCNSLKSINLKGLDTSNVKSMTWLFENCSALEKIDLSMLDLSKVTSLRDLFFGCTSLTSVKLPASKMPCNKTTCFMFGNCTSLRTIDLSEFDTSNVTDIGGMFGNCTSLESANLSSLDTSNVTKTLGDYYYGIGPSFDAGLFAGCKSLKTVDLSNWDLSNVEELNYCFAGCKSLESVKLPSKAMGKCTSLTGLFLDCTSLKSFDLSAINAPNATDVSSMFSECESLTNVKIPDGRFPNATSVGGMFQGCKSLESLDLTGLGSQTIANLNSRYQADYDYAPHEPTVDEIEGTMGKLVGTFEGCSSLRSLKLPDWDTSQVKDSDAAALMFNGCDSLEEISVGGRFEANAFPAACPGNASATGSWVDAASNAVYTPADVPGGTAATYLAQLKLDASDFKVDTSSEAFTGQPVVKDVTTDLVEGRDYQLSYANNTEPGTATLTITGIGRYTGAVEYSFEIAKQPEPTPDPQEQPTERIAGEESADTAAQIALEAFPEGSEWVVIARDDDFADAMSATGLAGALDAPIVLTDRNGLSGATADAVEKLKAKKAYIVGGTGAIPGDLEGALEAIGCRVEKRVFGQEAYDTSVECAKLIQEKVGGGTPYAVVAYGQNFQDALSMSSFAYRHKCPIFLQTYGDKSSQRKLPDEAKAMLTGDGAWAGAQVFVAGGYGAVSKASAEKALGAGRVVRLAGEDGFDTSNQIATYMVEKGLLSASTVCVANGAEKPKGTDALAGAALAGRKGGVMLLANANGACGEVSRATIEGKDSKGDAAFLAEHASEVSDAYVLGGSYVMPEDFRAEINGILG